MLAEGLQPPDAGYPLRCAVVERVVVLPRGDCSWREWTYADHLEDLTEMRQFGRRTPSSHRNGEVWGCPLAPGLCGGLAPSDSIPGGTIDTSKAALPFE